MKYAIYRRSHKSIFFIILTGILIVLIAGGITGYFVYNKKQVTDLNNVSVVKNKVGILYLLPTDEQPALATVTDSSKLSSSFAGKVFNGDKILIYEKNKRAIVYRPSINKVVDVEPVQIDAVDTLKK